jgi:hypothetical protein
MHEFSLLGLLGRKPQSFTPVIYYFFPNIAMVNFIRKLF